MEIELIPIVSLPPRDQQHPHRSRGDAGRSYQQPPGIAALQDPLHLRQPLPHPQLAEPQHHRAGCAPANTLYQLMTILEENHHSFLIVEHDPLLYEDAREMVGYLAQALKQASREATVLLYAPALDPHLQKIAGLADRVFCIYGEPAAQKEAKMPGAQRTLGAYS